MKTEEFEELRPLLATKALGTTVPERQDAMLEMAKQIFKDKAPTYRGGQRELAQMVELTDLCIARRAAMRPSIVEFLKKQ